MSKQTAVNFLRDEAIKLVVQAMQGTLNEDTLEYQISEIVTQALKMEREQIIDFCQMWEDSPLEKYDCKEDLFNETYGCKNENTTTTNKR
jgi:hypothetical protein